MTLEQWIAENSFIEEYLQYKMECETAEEQNNVSRET